MRLGSHGPSNIRESMSRVALIDTETMRVSLMSIHLTGDWSNDNSTWWMYLGKVHRNVETGMKTATRAPTAKVADKTEGFQRIEPRYMQGLMAASILNSA